MKNEIIFASGNKGKIKEVQEILNEYKIISMNELKIKLEVEEDGKTIEENAVKKAKTLAKMLEGKMCLADDSGIEIEYLNGFPGVQTKRWKSGTDRDRNLGIIEKLKGISKENRKMKFVTAMAISNGLETITSVEYLKGFVSEEPRGNNGFGFDEIFELENGKTLAELSDKEKNKISARKKSIQVLREKLK